MLLRGSLYQVADPWSDHAELARAAQCKGALDVSAMADVGDHWRKRLAHRLTPLPFSPVTANDRAAASPLRCACDFPCP